MFALDKPVGPTAAQALVALRESDPSLRGVKLGHAGRLDPMAEGLLTVLVGDENRAVHALRGESKTYEVDVLLGLASDSFDALGMLSSPVDTALSPAAIALACSRFGGDYSQRYRPFSQGRVNEWESHPSVLPGTDHRPHGSRC
jgi:tRNA pseudouridine55 synthase